MASEAAHYSVAGLPLQQLQQLVLLQLLLVPAVLQLLLQLLLLLKHRTCHLQLWEWPSVVQCQ
jgi:hypothetical protein